MALLGGVVKDALLHGAKFSEIRAVYPEATVILRGVVAEEQVAIDRAQELLAMGLIYEKWLQPES